MTLLTVARLLAHRNMLIGRGDFHKELAAAALSRYTFTSSTIEVIFK